MVQQNRNDYQKPMIKVISLNSVLACGGETPKQCPDGSCVCASCACAR